MSKWPKLDLKSPWGRLVLVPPEARDDVDVAAMRSDPETFRYIPFRPKTTSPEEWRTIREQHAKNDERWTFHIHLTSPSTPESSTFVSQCVIMHIDTQNRTGEIGIAVASRVYRTGIATEALYLVLKHAFEYPDLKLHRVQFVTGLDNIKMRGWLEGFGIELEYRMRETVSDGRGGWLDDVGYSILEGEWPALKAKMEKRIAAHSLPGTAL